MRVALLTREYPPDVYGGAGVHVDQLARQLRSRVDLEVHCWGEPRPEPDVFAHQPWAALASDRRESGAFSAFSIDLAMAGAVPDADILHSHTWYANLAGHLGGLAWGRPHVLTAHSLEPLRPWKAEQLGGGYRLSCFAEKSAMLGAAAVIAVSEGMRSDVLGCYPELDPARVRVIHNGVDTDAYRPHVEEATLRHRGIEPGAPYAVFLGRVTRQKGLSHLLAAARLIDPAYPILVLAGAPDTPEIAAEVAELAEQVRRERGNLVWVEGILPRQEVVELLSAATVFVCPSIYEPFGLVNAEAMACATAVVASRVGGIPEVVVDGRTGILVDYSEHRPAAFEQGLASAVESLLRDPVRARSMGEEGRRRAVEHFGWPRIADRTVSLYRDLLGG